MAEVKVKITAQNEVRTGLQQALQETQKFGQEAKRAVSGAMTITPFSGDDGLGPLRELQEQARALKELARAPIDASGGTGGAQGATLTAGESRRASTAIRGLAADLASVQTPGQAFEAVLTRLAQAAGRLTGLVIGFAVGKVLSSQFDKLNAGLETAISNASKFSSAFQSMGQASSLSEAISQFRQLNSAADQTGETLRNLQNDLGATLANIALGGGFKRGGVFGELAALEEAQRRAAGAQLVNNTQFLLGQSQGRLAVAGDSGAEQEFDRKARQAQELFALEQQLNAARAKGDTQLALDLTNAINLTKQRFEVEDQITQKRKEAADAAQALATRQQTAGVSRAIQDFGADPAALLARAQERLAALQNPNIAANIGLTPEQAELARKNLLLEILGLEQQVTSEREKQEQAQKADAERIAALERSVQSPEERRAALEDEQAALAQRAAFLAPDDFAGRAEVISEAQRIAGELSGLQDASATGSAGASAFQRIGFASNEFFDTRKAEDPAKETRRAAEFAREILNILKKGEPLVLPASS